jgi:hypothetical protein
MMSENQSTYPPSIYRDICDTGVQHNLSAEEPLHVNMKETFFSCWFPLSGFFFDAENLFETWSWGWEYGWMLHSPIMYVMESTDSILLIQEGKEAAFS